MLNWKRMVPVDINKYLPDFLKRDHTLKRLHTADNNEHERLRKRINDVLAQLTVHTATWGLVYWEELLGITPTDLDYANRRIEILMRLTSQLSVTPRFLERIANRYISDNSAVVIPNNEAYTFSLRYTKDACYDLSAVIKAIEMYKPAHLGFTIHEIRTLPIDLRVGGRIVSRETNILSQGTNYDIQPNSLTTFVGGGLFIYETLIIGGEHGAISTT